MQLSLEQLRELGRLADQWLDSDGATRERLQRSARNNGEQFAHAFEVMVAHLEHGVAEVTVRPIPSAVLDAAVAASMLSGGIAVGEHASKLSETGTSSDGTLTPPERAAGQRIGPYRLIRELGRGGMGVVWLAERADGQHTRQVALKMPLVENLNWLLAARFARERNILASLEHPGIARLYDAGVDNHIHSSQPYIAIEYVHGQPITSYVSDKKLKPEATVQLFTKVIEAVAHAHTQLIIHRDIKPSNILVDAKGEPHLLDFGIAKLLDDEDSNAIDATQLTKLSGRALTLDYASPEQVNNASLGTASDVYSLGVVLYELLTGTRPYHPKGPTRRDLEQAILDQDPQKPSDQLLTHSTNTATSNSETGKSARRMRGDLDTIVLTALRKDPKQRYATAQAFADDLKRYIAFEPIAARARGTFYSVGRFVRRHRLPLAVASGALLLVGALAVLALQQRQQAQLSAGRAEAVDSLLRHLFRGMSPDVAATKHFTAKELLDRTGRFVENDSRLDPTTRRETSRTMAGLYADIGDWDNAIALQALVVRGSANSTDRLQLIRAVAKFAEIYTSAEKYDEADKQLSELARLSESSNEAMGEGALLHVFHKARVALFRRQYTEAAKHYAVAVARARDAGVTARELLADALQGEGRARVEIGDLHAASERLEASQAIYAELGDVKVLDAIDTKEMLGQVRIRMGQYVMALSLLEPLLTDIEQRYGPGHAFTIGTLDNIAFAQLRLGKFDRVREATQRIRNATAPDSGGRERIGDYLDGLMAMYAGDYATAELLLRRVLSGMPAESVRTSGVVLNLAELLLRSGRADEAKRMLDDVKRVAMQESGAASGLVAATHILLGCWHAQKGELGPARLLVADAAANLKTGRGTQHPYFIVASAYVRLFADAQRSKQDTLDAAALADQLERDLSWQRGAALLAEWLREPNVRRQWSKIPIVL